MRVLFTSVPGYGHILPMVPLMQAALDDSHDVAFLATDDVREVAVRELPSAVQFLPAGVSFPQLHEEAARRDDGDPFHPTPSMLGEMFGLTRLDLDGEASLTAARGWRPDAILADAFDSIGPMLAADLGVPWHQVGLGPGLPNALADEIPRSANAYYERAGLTATAPTTYVDPCPTALQDPGWVAPATALRLRTQPHRRSTRAWVKPSDFSDTSKPTVLVTLGTIFSESDTLVSLVSAVSAAGVNVRVTLGGGEPHPGPSSHEGDVQWVEFVPLDELLDGVDLVVAAGGSGTVLGSLSRGLPMVLYPQGADQPINAARAESAGVAVVVDSADEVTAAVVAALDEPSFRARAREVAADVAAAPSAAQVISRVLETSLGASTGETSQPTTR